jgi:prepilin-type N-terminal cleavage/methylation domain-containing protein
MRVAQSRCPGRRAGFTLVEMIVVIAVLAIIVLVISQITGLTMNATRYSNRSVDTASQARLAFERLRYDFAGLIKRTDVDFLAGNPSPLLKSYYDLLFLSYVTSSPSTPPPPGGNRNLSVVGYQIAADSDNNNCLCLLRSAKPVGWSTAGFAGLNAAGLPVRFSDATFPAGLLATPPSYSPTDWDVLAPGIIRMVIGFILYPDQSVVTLENGTQVTSEGQVVYSPPIRTDSPYTTANPYLDLNHISSIVVGVVALDNTLKILNAGQIVQLANAFATPSDASNQLPLQAWAATAANPSAMPGNIPLLGRQTVRVFQCFFPITPLGTQTL